MKCWGDGNDGGLGQGNTLSLGDSVGEMGDNLLSVDLGTDRTATDISVGNNHVCAVLDDSSLKCWGDSAYYKVGNYSLADVGDAAGEMGDNLSAVDLGSGTSIDKVYTPNIGNFSCAVTNTENMACWGDNYRGQAGINSNDSMIGSVNTELGDSTQFVAVTSINEVALGYEHTCIINSSGNVKCWGRNDKGQLGYGHTSTIGDHANEVTATMPDVSLGTNRTAVKITAGYKFTCAILDDGSVKCWGDGTSGALGSGSTSSLGNQANEMGDNLPVVDLGTSRTAVDISAGYYYTCAVLDNRDLKCWGSNIAGKLGLGDTNYRGDNSGEMGDNLPAVDL